jgi:hypothetical protein
MDRINELIERIGYVLVESVPENDWTRIYFLLNSISSYGQAKATYFRGDGSSQTYAARVRNKNGRSDHASDLARKLRDEMYKHAPDKGAWFIMKMVITSDRDFKAHFDYYAKPDFSIQIDDVDYVRDYQAYPRSKEIMPPWLFEILSRNRIV